MYIGVDVGGTYTDAVLLEKGKVRAWAKVPTREDLLSSLQESLDIILKDVPAELIVRVVISTTMITNMIAEKKYDPVGLIMVPGPGFSHSHYSFNTDSHIVAGAIDFRGREITPLDLRQVESGVKALAEKNHTRFAVVGKFSSRNNKHEKDISAIISQTVPGAKVEMGHQVAGQLNFPRRVVSTLLTCATRDKYQYFTDSVMQALEKRGISCSVYILKADGGTMRFKTSTRVPIETIFSGPAASTLGVQALIPPGETALVVDIGGTTSDLALILSGQPLLASRGASVHEQLTHVRALAVKSVPVGGDSVVDRVGKDIILYSERLGQPYCMGGPAPTPTDALRVLGHSMLGDVEKAREAMDILGQPLGISPWEVAAKIVSLVVDAITREIGEMFRLWEQEPAYRVWEVLQKKKVRPGTVVGVGGSASGFLTQIAARLNCYPVIPPYARVANAIGAAVARPTVKVSLRADTQQGIYTIQEEGFQDNIENAPLTEDKAMELAKKWLHQRAQAQGLEGDLGEIEITRREVFNMVRDWVTCGKIFDIVVQTQRGILHYVGTGVAGNE